MNLYFLIAGGLGIWVFALILSNERQMLIHKMESEIPKNPPPIQSDD